MLSDVYETSGLPLSIEADVHRPSVIDRINPSPDGAPFPRDSNASPPASKTQHATEMSDIIGVTSADPLVPTHCASSGRELATEDVVNVISNLKCRPMLPGETWYLVSRRWWTELEQHCQSQNLTMDNSDIVDHNGVLLPGLSLGLELGALPPEAWALLTFW